MAWIASLAAEAADGKVTNTLNGPPLFNNGAFSIQYGTFTTTSTSAISLLTGAAVATTTNPLAVSGAPTAVNLAGDPSGKWPASTVYLPGFNSKSVQIAPMGSLPAGTVLRGRFMATATFGGTVTVILYLRNAVTGAATYSITSGAMTPPTTSSAGAIIEINVVATSSTVLNTMVSLVSGAGAVVAAPVATTVDLTQDYVLDASITMGTSGSWAQILGMFELVG